MGSQMQNLCTPTSLQGTEIASNEFDKDAVATAKAVCQESDSFSFTVTASE